MPERFSSRWTFFGKFVLPLFSVCWGAYVAFVLMSRPQSGFYLPVEGRWAIFFAFGVLYPLCCYWAFGRSNRVLLDGDSLLISNYLREVRVPLAHVVAVNTRLRSQLRITFDPPTPFGREVIVLPPFEPRRLWRDPSLLARLRRFIEQGT